MNRREALRVTTLSLGSLLLATNGVLTACGRSVPKRSTSGMLNADQQDLVEAMADTLLPTTPSSPGARAANAGSEINLLVTDCYPAKSLQLLTAGLAEVQSRAKKPFAELPRADRESILRRFDTESRGKTIDEHWFPLFRELALRSYFSSEVGMTKALRFQMVPGKWVGCTPLEKGQVAWA